MATNPKIGWIKTAGFLTIVYEGKPISIKSGTEKYKKTLQLIKKNKKQDLIDYIFPNKRIEKFSKGQIKIDKTGEVIDTKNKFTLPTTLTKKLCEFVENSFSWRAFKKFLENVAKNPDKDSREQLFYFLEHNSFPITADGCFLAYKYVTKLADGKLVDSHSKSIINDPGCTPAMDRSKCDNDRSVACSTGLHVAAFDYAKKCGSGEIIIEVKVNPKDVVSVPYDYYNQKMRVCRYEVLRKGNEEVKKSYLNQKFYAGKKEQKLSKIHEELEKMTARQIVERVVYESGEKITLSLKNKKSIVKKAFEILSSKQITTLDTISLKNKSAKEIIDLVRTQTGEEINLSLKNKKGIVKKAISFLVDHGLKVDY